MQHFNLLLRGEHQNKILQDAFRKYDANLIATEIEVCSPEHRVNREQHFIDTLRPEYNISKLASGVEHTPETRGKIAASLMGRPKSEETKAKLRASALGKIMSDEARAKMSAAGRGRRLTEEHKRRIAEANTGLRHSEETLQKLRGKKVLTDESRALMSAAQTGKRATDETRRKMSESHLRNAANRKSRNEQSIEL